MSTIKTATQGTKLKCKECGLILIQVPHKLKRHDMILAEWVVAENIEGAKPVAGDAFSLTCICGSNIVILNPDYLIMGD